MFKIRAAGWAISLYLLLVDVYSSLQPSVQFLAPHPNSTIVTSIHDPLILKILVEDIPSVNCNNFNLAIHSTNPPQELQQVSLCTCSQHTSGDFLPAACFIHTLLYQVIMIFTLIPQVIALSPRHRPIKPSDCDAGRERPATPPRLCHRQLGYMSVVCM